MLGKLSIVATPIGNLDDLSPRAAETLRRADLVACEDTRRTGRLLAHLELKRPLLSLHEHNEKRRLDDLLERLGRGESIALVSDAGTPLVSDPGYLLVRAAIERGVAVEAVPGPSAATVALVASGLPPYPFTFLGFPPAKQGKRRRFFGSAAKLDHTLIFFESPHRIVASLADAIAELGDRRASVSRELTKLHEETLRGRLSEVLSALESRAAVKGELTVVVDRRRDQTADE